MEKKRKIPSPHPGAGKKKEKEEKRRKIEEKDNFPQRKNIKIFIKFSKTFVISAKSTKLFSENSKFSSDDG